MRAKLIVWLVAIAAGVGMPVRAVHAAESAEGSATGALPRADLTIVGNPAGAGVLEARVMSWFHGQGTVTSKAREAVLKSEAVFSTSNEPGVRVWIVLRTSDAAQLFFVVQERVGAAARYLVLDVPLADGLDELGVEHLAQVCYLSATALWAGNSPESSRQEVADRIDPKPALAASSPIPARPVEQERRVAPTPPVAAPAPAASSGSKVVRTGLEAAARFQGDEQVAFVPGAAVGGGWRRDRFEIGGSLHAGLFLPRSVEKENVELELNGLTFSLGFALAHRATRHVWLNVEAGPGLDLVRYRTSAVSDPSLEANPGGSDARAFGYLLAGVRSEFSALSLSAGATVAGFFTRTHYDIAEQGADSELIVPWVVQPGLYFGASWLGP